jgi:hypothetical protein
MIDRQASCSVRPHMEAAIQQAFDDLLLANPEMSFWEASSELVTKGEINFEATEDPAVHTWLYQLFQRAKIKANADRVNRDM